MQELVAEIANGSAERDERLRSPVFKGWLRRFILVQNWDTEDDLLMEQVRFINNMRYNFQEERDWSAILGVKNGVCMTWDCRVALRGMSVSEVLVDKRGRHLSVCVPNGPFLFEADIPDGRKEDSDGKAVVCAPKLPNTEIPVRNDLPLLQLKLNDNQLLDRNNAVDYRNFDHRTESYGPADISEFQDAASLVEDAWSDEYEDWRKTLRVVIPRNAPQGWVMNGMTAASHQGACWIAARGLLRVLEALVHEQSHIKLRYVEETYPILSESQTEERFVVGWRQDPRPIVGIYEGIYVNLHSIEALLRVAEKGMLSEDQISRCRNRASDLRDQVESAVEILREHARFTEIGEGFLLWSLSKIEYLAT
jgi:HEXXH motif-containing protein